MKKHQFCKPEMYRTQYLYPSIKILLMIIVKKQKNHHIAVIVIVVTQ